MANLRTSYEEKDIVGFAELFDPDVFTFHPVPTSTLDEGGDLPICWDWTLELEATREFFERSGIHRIKLDFVRGPKVVAVPADEVPKEWIQIALTEVELEIDFVYAEGGENIIYKISGDAVSLFFQRYPRELIRGKPRVRIVKWKYTRVGPSPEAMGQLPPVLLEDN